MEANLIIYRHFSKQADRLSSAILLLLQLWCIWQYHAGFNSQKIKFGKSSFSISLPSSGTVWEIILIDIGKLHDSVCMHYLLCPLIIYIIIGFHTICKEIFISSWKATTVMKFLFFIVCVCVCVNWQNCNEKIPLKKPFVTKNFHSVNEKYKGYYMRRKKD